MARLTPAVARERFAAARVARLATVTADGSPRVVPIVFAVAGDTLYSAVDAKPKRTTALRRLADVAGDPRVCALADHYEEEWSRLWWARADGVARTLDPVRDAEGRRAVTLLAERYPQQTVAGAVLVIDVTRWSGWSASGA